MLTEPNVAPHGAPGHDTEDTQLYQVVVNLEDQYSVWPADSTPPAGWRADGVTGPRAHCLNHIEERWTDMRPLSLRRAAAAEETKR